MRPKLFAVFAAGLAGMLLAAPAFAGGQFEASSIQYYGDAKPGKYDKKLEAAMIRKAAEILGIDPDDAFVEASRLPPDMREDVGNVVRMYRREVTEKK